MITIIRTGGIGEALHCSKHGGTALLVLEWGVHSYTDTQTREIVTHEVPRIGILFDRHLARLIDLAKSFNATADMLMVRCRNEANQQLELTGDPLRRAWLSAESHALQRQGVA
jgi:hypothetical protein